MQRSTSMRNIGDAIANIFYILIGIAVIIGSIRLHLGTPTEPGPGFFPFISGITLIALSVVLLVYAWLGRSTGMQVFGEPWRPGILLIGLFVHSLILDFVGYVVATIMLSAVILLVMGVKTTWKIVAVSLVLSIGSYILFDRLLGITLPQGILKVIVQ